MRTALPALALSLGLIGAGASWPEAAAAKTAKPSAHAAIAKPTAKASEPAPALETVAQVTDWVIASSDNGSLPFVIIDKVAAEVFVFGADGQFKGAAPALLGSARGDRSWPGVGDRELSNIPPKQRTTPAGRFIAGFGPAYGGKSVLWVDYSAAVSLHAVITANPKEHRLQRLQTPTPKDNRITFGCINVPAAFYKDVVRPAFKGTSGIVYILPEKRPLGEILPGFQTQHTVAAAEPDQASTDIAAAEPDDASAEVAAAEPAQASSDVATADQASADVAAAAEPDPSSEVVATAEPDHVNSDAAAAAEPDHPSSDAAAAAEPDHSSTDAAADSAPAPQ